MKRTQIKDEFKKKLFQSGLFVMADQTQDPPSPEAANLDKDQEQVAQIDVKGIEKDLEGKKGNIPNDVFKKAQSILRTGSPMEKFLVKRLVSGTITPQRFRLLLKFLFYPDGDEAIRDMKKELAEKEISGKLSAEVFELAIGALNRDDPGDRETVHELLREKIGPALLKKRLESIRSKLAQGESIEGQEKEIEARKEEDMPDTVLSTQKERLGAITRREMEVSRSGTPDSIRTTVEFRNYSGALRQSWKLFESKYDDLSPIFQKMAGKENIGQLYDAVFGLLPDVIRRNERSLTKDELKHSLEKLQTRLGKKIKIETHIDEIFKAFEFLQTLRIKILEQQVKVTEISKAAENAVSREAIAQTARKGVSKFVGFEVKEGQRFQYNTKILDPQTKKETEGEDVAEILSVRFSEPVTTDDNGEVLTNRGTGSVIITVSGVGEMHEGQFKKWVDATDATQIISDKQELDRVLGVNDMGRELKAGDEIAYRVLTGRDANGNITDAEEKVKIVRIIGTRIELDTEVVTLRREEAPRLAFNGELPEDRKSKVMTLGQFAKWYTRRNVVPVPASLQDLRNAVANLTQADNKKYNREEGHFKAPQLVQNEVLFEDTPHNPQTFVIQIDEKNKTIYFGGERLTYAEALRVIKDRELLSLDPEVEAKKQTQILSYKMKPGDQVAQRRVASEQKAVAAQTQRKIARSIRLNEDAMNSVAAMHTKRKAQLQASEVEEEPDIDLRTGQERESIRDQVMQQGAMPGLGAATEEEDDEAPLPDIPQMEKIKEWAEVANVPEAMSVTAGAKEIAEKPTYSYIKTLWQSTNLLSIQDLWEFGKAAYEYHVRRWQRNVKNNFANIGKHFPYIGTEMDRVAQSAETEEVNQFKEAMDQWGVWQIEDTLYTTKNKDQTKACLIVLSSKGQMRWEDIRLWETINKFVGPKYYIPIPPNGDFTTQDSEGRTGLDYLSGAMDSLWGEGQYNEWSNESNTKFEQTKKSFHQKGDQLEGDPKNIGGVTAELGNLLSRHKRGDYVDAQEYEGLIDFCIHKGKSSAEAKLYYLVEGCAAKNDRGQTILPWDRIGNLDGEYLNRLPMLDFFTEKFTKKAFQDKARPWKRQDFEKLCVYWDGGENKIPDSVKKGGKPPREAIDFLWAEVLRHPWVLARNTKGLRNAEQIDHDDAHVIVPLSNEQQAQNLCGGPSGSKKYFTDEAITNAYPGYNRYIKTLAEHKDVPKLLSSIKSFARFNAIVNDRYLKSQEDRYVRITKTNYYRRSIACNLFTIDHRDQLEDMLKRIGKAYNWDVSLMFKETKDIKTKPSERAKQDSIEDFIKGFGKELEDKVRSDGGVALMKAVKESNLTGIDYDLPEGAVEERRKKYENAAQIYGVFAGKL